MQHPKQSTPLPFLEIEQESHHLGALAAISLACLLLVAIKGNALLQYWQQTHHIFMGVGALPDITRQLPGHQAFSRWEEATTLWLDEGDKRLMLAGQLLLRGDEALPKPVVPIVETPKCPEPAAPAQPVCPAPVATETQADPDVPRIANVHIADGHQQHGLTPAVAIQEAVAAAQVESAHFQSSLAPPTEEQLEAAKGPIALRQGDRLLLIGDSLMQGVAPHLITALKRTYKVESMDLSRHSTGLTYPAFFDWPATVTAAFELENYQVVIVFLGANDPWDMNLHGSYVRFGSERWREVYSGRVKKIIQTAADHNARLLWLGAPPMGRGDLVGKEPLLNEIYAQEADNFPLAARFIATGPSLSVDGISFTKFLELPERGSVMVRTDDGVHFTTQGHKILAHLVLSHFTKATAPATSPMHASASEAESRPMKTAPSPDAESALPGEPVKEPSTEPDADPMAEPPPDQQTNPAISQR